MRTKLATGLIAITLVAGAPLVAQHTIPNVATTPGSTTTVLGSTIFINHGLVGVGRLSASMLDQTGETFGSMSGLQITDWHRISKNAYIGTFNILPDRGYNAGSFFSDYAARINKIGFVFKPHEAATGIGGATLAERVAAQDQVRFTTPVFTRRFTYQDPASGTQVYTTGLDPGAGYTTALFGGQPMPFVVNYFGPAAPGPADCLAVPAPVACQSFPINRLPLDAEALVLKDDGSGYIGDEYGAHIYYFNRFQRIVGAIVPPQAMEPHGPAAGIPNFNSLAPGVNGRRNNQGLEGVALSPDGTRLMALFQSAMIQDSDGSQQNRRQTRLLVYDVSSDAVPSSPIAEYVLTLPTWRLNPNTSPGAVNRTAAQSEIVAIDNNRLLVLSRDGNGLGHIDPNPSVYKSVLLVDIGVGAPTNVAGEAARNAEGGRIIAPGAAPGSFLPGVLDPLIVPLSRVEALNLLNSTQLSKFNMELDTSGQAGPPYQVSKLTLGEKWEGLSLVSAKDPDRPNDYFLFAGNDNDFLTSDGRMRGPDGSMVSYNGFDGYAPTRVPAPVDSTKNENDTVVLVYRVTIISGATAPGTDVTPPVITPEIEGKAGSNGWYTSPVKVTWNVEDPESGIVSKADCDTTLRIFGTSGVDVTCRATNGRGLQSQVTVTIKVDYFDPLLFAPPNQTVVATGSAVVHYPAPKAVDWGSGLASVGCAPPSGSVFPQGVTTVVCKAVDHAGNESTDTFRVTVRRRGGG